MPSILVIGTIFVQPEHERVLKQTSDAADKSLLNILESGEDLFRCQ